MLGKTFVAAAIAALLVFAPGETRADQVGDAVAALGASVTDVRLVGEWHTDGRDGVYRVLFVGDPETGGTSRLFVQWLTTDGNTPVVERSIEIPELGQLGIVVYDFAYEVDDEGLALFIESFDPAKELELGYELYLKAPDDYIFQPISN